MFKFKCWMTHATNKRITSTAFNRRCKNCALWNNLLQYITTFDVGANCYFLIIAIRVYYVNSQRISCMIIPDFINIYTMTMRYMIVRQKKVHARISRYFIWTRRYGFDNFFIIATFG